MFWALALVSVLVVLSLVLCVIPTAFAEAYNGSEH